MLETQGGGCAICKRPPKKLRLSVDHDHKTGLVRGLLCFGCNSILRNRVTVEWLFEAHQYLEAPPVEQAIGRTPQGVVGSISKGRRKKRGKK